jgi:hypothetical protein
MKPVRARSLDMGMVTRVTIPIALGVAAFVAVSGAARSVDDGNALFGAPAWKSAKVVKGGKSHPLFDETAVGCAQRLHRQDRWLGRFFGSDPKWARHGRTLRLDSGADRIVLKRRA